jgi:glutamate mutase epsilon subunit
LGYATTNNATANDATVKDATTNDATANDATVNNATKNDAPMNDATMNDATMNNATANHATMNDDIANNATANERYDKQFLSIKSGCYNEHRCYNKRGEILSANVARVRVHDVGSCHFDIERQLSSLLSFVRFSYQ